MRPPVPYHGGKQRIADQIVALLPPHEHYVEPYCGGLSVLLAKPRSRMETVNDLDGELVTYWRVLRDRPGDLEVAVGLTPHSRAEHVAAFTPAADDLEVARRVHVRLTQGVNARLRPTGWRWHRKTAGGSTMTGYLAWYRDRIPAAAERLVGVSLDCRPALEVAREYGTEPSALLYVDPPYPAEVRNSSNYRCEMSDPADHRELAKALHECRAAVVVSGYACDLYDRELYPDWHRHEIAAQTTQGGSAKATAEVLWSNRPLGVQGALFDVGGRSA
ncbi:DNA adenine methylase [Micromonospora sp. WMMD1102]|uniref:DNA adenine methylase n=1 Tax=Micromonospora sp. WMMD1102 TaxID=3016105 RepID=UPI00241541B7|nr:DNA adenine methylase [Micromonospora sp. WMMD1102]MDG4784328.1 DNA adenine methylase [Micromonospora sp. WMMD1102]MDG4784401.1 DNA adenine methylase [Micromonospora sp. WMMD1102]MDG4791905.1 DNA adenine methylase [Micromonospora sp. WMMD1102]